MGSDCDSGDFGSGGVFGIVTAVIQLVLSIIEVAS